MGIYTEDQHAVNLLEMLESHYAIGSSCPAVGHMGFICRSSCCKVCLNFIGLDAISKEGYLTVCPCNELGCKEAAKRTWIALEEKGYI